MGGGGNRLEYGRAGDRLAQGRTLTLSEVIRAGGRSRVPRGLGRTVFPLVEGSDVGGREEHAVDGRACVRSGVIRWQST